MIPLVSGITGAVRGSHPEVFLEKGILKTCSKFTGEQPCQSVISINLLHIFKTSFSKNTLVGCFCAVNIGISKSLFRLA